MTDAEDDCSSNGETGPVEFGFGAELAIDNKKQRREKPC
jgi:hypothetical protein